MEAQLLVPNNSAELEQTYKTESNLPLPCGQPGTLQLYTSEHWKILIGINKHSDWQIRGHHTSPLGTILILL